MDDLRGILAEAEQDEVDMARISVVQEVQIRKGGNLTRSDMEVSIRPDASTSVIERRVDPNNSHPFTAHELLRKANASRSSDSQLNSHDLTCIAWKLKLRENPEYTWMGKNYQSPVWSGRALRLLKTLSEKDRQDYREQYKKHRAVKRTK